MKDSSSKVRHTIRRLDAWEINMRISEWKKPELPSLQQSVDGTQHDIGRCSGTFEEQNTAGQLIAQYGKGTHGCYSCRQDRKSVASFESESGSSKSAINDESLPNLSRPKAKKDTAIRGPPAHGDNPEKHRLLEYWNIFYPRSEKCHKAKACPTTRAQDKVPLVILRQEYSSERRVSTCPIASRTTPFSQLLRHVKDACLQSGVKIF